MFRRQIRQRTTVIFMLGVMPLLMACAETKRVLGQAKEAPDEFRVYQRAPLSLPPDYVLRPPAPGTKRPQSVNPRDRVKKALGIKARIADRSNVGRQQNLRSLSKGERAILNMAGADQVDPAIRQLIDKESAGLFEEDRSLTDKLVFWHKKAKFGTAVDPVREQKRIQESQALGEPLKSKNIPVISRKKKALFEGVFD